MKNLENNPDNDKDPRVKFRKLINAAVNNASSLLNAKLTEKDLEARLEEIGANDDRKRPADRSEEGLASRRRPTLTGRTCPCADRLRERRNA